MINILLLYVNYQYAIKVTDALVNKYVENYPYMSGYGVSVMLPDHHIERAGIAKGLLSDIPNHGSIITEVE
jgi:hypothetical protein